MKCDHSHLRRETSLTDAASIETQTMCAMDDLVTSMTIRGIPLGEAYQIVGELAFETGRLAGEALLREHRRDR